MNIGIVSYWFNRGQATVGRYIRTIYDELGYETRVLARPTKDKFTLPSYATKTDVWNQAGVTFAGRYDISIEEYRRWVADNNIDVVFFDQNYQFDEISTLRSEGIITIGRFVWESFEARHVPAAKEAFSIIYSLTRCEQERYAAFGIDSPHIPWGCHPELERHRKAGPKAGRQFLYPGGFMSTRKPTAAAVTAFRRLPDASWRLLIKTQRPLVRSDLVIPDSFADVSRARKNNEGCLDLVLNDPRIEVLEEDLTAESYYDLLAGTDVLFAPSRWEGLGLHLYEGLALGIPIISCDIPPINEVIRHGVDGWLVECRPIGKRKSGITIYEPIIERLLDGLKVFTNPGRLEEMSRNTSQSRQRWTWENTRTAYQALLTSVLRSCS